MWVTSLGVAAAIVSCASLAPQLLKLLRDRHIEGVSIRGYAVTSCAFLLWLAYGVALHAPVIVISNTVSLGLSLSIIAAAMRARRRT